MSPSNSSSGKIARINAELFFRTINRKPRRYELSVRRNARKFGKIGDLSLLWSAVSNCTQYSWTLVLMGLRFQNQGQIGSDARFPFIRPRPGTGPAVQFAATIALRNVVAPTRSTSPGLGTAAEAVQVFG
jgi:hypothetical protein